MSDELTGEVRQALRDDVLRLATNGRLDRRDRRRLLRAVPARRADVPAFKRDVERSDLITRDAAVGIVEPGDDRTRELVRELVATFGSGSDVAGKRVMPRARASRPAHRRTRTAASRGDPGSEPEPSLAAEGPA